MAFPAILFAGVAVMVLFVVAISIPWGSGASSTGTSSSSTTPLGCEAPDRGVRIDSSTDDAWLYCTEAAIAELPFCNADISGIAPARRLIPNVSGSQVLTQYYAYQKLVVFWTRPDPVQMLVSCGGESRTLSESDLQAITSPGDLGALPASLR